MNWYRCRTRLHPFTRFLLLLPVCIALFAVGGGRAAAQTPAPPFNASGATVTRSGILTVLWGKPNVYLLVDEADPTRRTPLLLEDAVGQQAGGLLGL